MNRASEIVDAMLEGYYSGAAAPVAPPKPTIAPTRPQTPSRPRPGTRPWNPSVRPGVSPRPKARQDDDQGHGFAENKMMPAEKKFNVQLGRIHKNVSKVNQRISALPPIPGMKKHTAKPGRTPFAEAEGAMSVPPAPHDEGTPDDPQAAEPANLPSLSDYIRPGDRVTIHVHGGMGRHGREYIVRTGRAVMRSSHGGWVLNMGGPHGTPGLADEENIISIRRGGRVIYGKK